MPKTLILRVFIHFFILIFFENYSFSQQYNFKHYTVDNGFPAAQPNEVFQDNKGFIWICTLGEGIARFDGINVKTYTTKDGLPNDQVRSIAQGKDGLFWMGTESGLSTFDGTKFFKIKNKALDSVSIRDIFVDKKGNIWFGTYGNGLVKYDGKSFRHFSEKDGLKEKSIVCITEDHHGNIWLGTIAAGIIKYDGTSFVRYKTEDGLSDNTVRSLIVDKKNVIWAGTDKGLRKFENGVFTVYRTTEGLVNDLVYDICEDKEGNIWAGTLGGISQFNGKSFQNYTTEQGLTSNLIYHISQDQEGNIWIGTDMPGISMFGVHQISYYTQKIGLSENSVYGICEDTQKNLWFTTYGGGANKYEKGHFKTPSDKVIAKMGILLAVLKDKKGNIWFSGADGVIKYDGKNFIKLPYEFYNSAVFSIKEDSKGNIWFGTKGLVKFDGKKFTAFNASNDFVDNLVFAIHEDTKGNIWAGTMGRGAFKYDGQNFTQITQKEGLLSGTIFSIAEDKTGNIWFGTDGKGVSKLSLINENYKVAAVFDTKDGLSHNSAQSIIFDNAGYLWVGTSNGICKIDAPQHDLHGQKVITNFGKNEGFISVECNQNSTFKDSQGFLWFGTVGGAIRFKPATDSIYSNTGPNIYISNVRLFYKDVNWSKYGVHVTKYFNLPEDLKLSYNNNYLTFDFIGIHFSNPSKVKYQFRLIPEDEDWFPVTNKNEATSSNLSPGNYTFQVRATTNGVWNTPPAFFSFTILKPFWKTWWFYFLILIIIVSLIYAYISSHTRTLRVIQKDLETKVQQRTYQLEEQNNKLQDAYKVIEDKNSEITDSIRYAKNIQEAILPPMHLLKNFLPDSFVFFMPKDIVSGDFYWLAQTESKVVVAAVDCTGHGVPGAFMSFVGFNLLNQIVNQAVITQPSEILNHLNISLNESLRNTLRRSDIKDGMDIAICTIDIKKRTAEYAGAYNPLYHIRDKQLTVFPADRFPVGSYMEMSHKKFTNHKIKLLKGDSLYIFTDGYSDQFGGQEDKKFMYSRFRNLLINIQDLNMTEQKLVLYKEFQNWKGINEQVDDILVIGIRV